MNKTFYLLSIILFSLVLSSCSESYKVSFDSLGGTLIDPLVVSEGNSASLPIPVRKGYIFVGWFTGEGPNDTQYSDYSTITQDVTLYARWRVNPFEYIKQNNEIIITGYDGISDSVVIPGEIDGLSVTAIGDNAISNKGLTDVTIPEGIKIIGDYAFSDNQISNLNLPNSIVSIGDYAFLNNQYTDLIIPPNVEIIGNYAFKSNSLERLTISTQLIESGIYPFDSFRLTDVTISEHVTYLSGSTLRWKYVNNLNLNNNPNFIHENSLLFTSDKKRLIAGVGQFASLEIPDSVTIIGDYAFNANRLKEVEIPNGIIEIGELAFQSNEITTLLISNGVKSIGATAFGSNQLKYLTLPDTIDYLGPYAFAFNDLTNVNFSSSLTDLSSGVFAGNQFTNIILPNSIQSIGYGSFRSNNLIDITIPESVSQIGRMAFSYNDIENITIMGDMNRFNNIWEEVGFPLELKPE